MFSKRALLAVLLAAIDPAIAAAQPYASKPIRFVALYPAGGPLDTVTRLLGAEPVGNRPEEFAAYIRREAEKYARLVKASGARVD